MGRSDAAVASRGTWLGVVWAGCTSWALAHHVELLSPHSGWGAWVRLAVVTSAAAIVGRRLAPRLLMLVTDGGRVARRSVTSLAVACLLALVLPLGFDVRPLSPVYVQGVAGAVYRLTVAGAAIVSIATVALGAWTWLTRRSLPPADEPRRVPRMLWARMAAPCWAVWSLYLLAFWPAVMSVDSVKQWDQLLTGKLTDAHPAVHTITLWALTRLWWSPAAVAATQVVVLGALVGVTLACLWRAGVPKTVVIFVAGVSALLPATGALAVTLWKDVPYAAAVLALTCLLLRIVLTDGSWLERRWAAEVLGLAIAAVALFHHGGRAVAVGTLAVLSFAYRPRWRVLRTATALAAVTWLAVNGAVLSAFDVERDHPGMGQIAIHHIAAHLDAGTRTTAAEWEVLRKVVPPDWSYDCRSHNPVVHSHAPGREQRWAALRAEAGELTRISWTLFLRDPMVDVRHVICNSELVWRIRGGEPGEEMTAAIHNESEGPLTEESLLTVAHRGENLGLRREPVLGALTLPLARFVLETSSPRFSWLFWRGPLALYVLLGAVAVAVVRTSVWRMGLVAVPALLVTAVVVTAAPAQDFRYMFPVYLVSVVMSVPLVTLGAGVTPRRSDPTESLAGSVAQR